MRHPCTAKRNVMAGVCHYRFGNVSTVSRLRMINGISCTPAASSYPRLRTGVIRNLGQVQVGRRSYLLKAAATVYLRERRGFLVMATALEKYTASFNVRTEDYLVQLLCIYDIKYMSVKDLYVCCLLSSF